MEKLRFYNKDTQLYPVSRMRYRQRYILALLAIIKNKFKNCCCRNR